MVTFASSFQDVTHLHISPQIQNRHRGGQGLKHKKEKKKPLGVKWLFFGKSKILALSLLSGMPARELSRLSLQRVSSGAFGDMDRLPGKCWLKGRHVLLHLYLERAEDLYWMEIVAECIPVMYPIPGFCWGKQVLDSDDGIKQSTWEHRRSSSATARSCGAGGGAFHESGSLHGSTRSPWWGW